MSEEIWRRAVAHVAALATGAPLAPGLAVTLHFHPDRLTRTGEPILDAMRRDGRYRSQFETGTGNGGLTAHRGGDRWRWESRLFGAVYDDAGPEHRPVYGSLNHLGSPAGGSPRFGSSHFRLAPHVLERVTFCYPDSFAAPSDFGVRDRMALVELVAAADPLDAYVEAHVHGPVLLDRDVDALVLDPSYAGTPVETSARALPCPVEWHPGFRAGVDALEPGYRPDAGRDHARLLAEGGVLVPRLIGDAAREPGHDPQLVKWAWHYLARFGSPIVSIGKGGR
ncbi:DUF3626 domain-containing protein [Catenuloplanes japonicus]|uniref:DUF3626 domain-containing protein n=1 Tax=Catenuloplanes japonicus TaxID=33876 RepID=UPI000527A16B|nr:DUF3626 domain-containing protein [Catenuloplanes japonicus]